MDNVYRITNENFVPKNKENKRIVDQSAKIMFHHLRINNHKTGWHWCKFTDLFYHLKDEVEEIEEALINGNYEDVVRETADLQNLAAMIMDNAIRRITDAGQTLPDAWR